MDWECSLLQGSYVHSSVKKKKLKRRKERKKKGKWKNIEKQTERYNASGLHYLIDF